MPFYDIESAYPWSPDMSTVNIRLLQRYRVDREAGATANGPENLVILVLAATGVPEMAFAISKVDAEKISIQLHLAAMDAQSS